MGIADVESGDILADCRAQDGDGVAMGAFWKIDITSFATVLFKFGAMCFHRSSVQGKALLVDLEWVVSISAKVEWVLNDQDFVSLTARR